MNVVRLAIQVTKPGAADPGAARLVDCPWPPAVGRLVEVGLGVPDELVLSVVPVGRLNPGRSAAPGLRLDTVLSESREVPVVATSSQISWKEETAARFFYG